MVTGKSTHLTITIKARVTTLRVGYKYKTMLRAERTESFLFVPQFHFMGYISRNLCQINLLEQEGSLGNLLPCPFLATCLSTVDQTAVKAIKVSRIARFEIVLKRKNCSNIWPI